MQAYIKWVLLYLLLINTAAFVLCGVDKLKAKKNWWRIPEKTLLLSAALGGSVGFLLGMKLFRHKTRHKQFTIGVPAILFAQIGLVIWLYLR